MTALYVGRMDAAARREAASKLADAWQPDTIFLASSDFTHYGRHLRIPAIRHRSRGRREPARTGFRLHRRRRQPRFRIVPGDHRKPQRQRLRHGPIALLLDVLRARGADGVYQSVLDYQTSGEIGGDYQHSVSYAALGYYPRSSFNLEESDRAALLDAAAETLRQLRATGDRRPATATGVARAIRAPCGIRHPASWG